jgi:Lrp/AsnC family leucine-responsive transcriptional regulator
VDDIDRKILQQLVVDGRASLTAIAQLVSLSVPAVKRRIGHLERDGVIKGYTAIVQEPGAPKLHALVELFCSGQTERQDILDVFQDRPEVLLAFTVAGDSDVIMLVRTDSTDHLESLLLDLRRHPLVRQTRSQIMLNTLMGRITL